MTTTFRTIATVQDKRITSVTFTSTPSFLYARDVAIQLPGIGTIQIDIAWGGNGACPSSDTWGFISLGI